MRGQVNTSSRPASTFSSPPRSGVAERGTVPAVAAGADEEPAAAAEAEEPPEVEDRAAWDAAEDEAAPLLWRGTSVMLEARVGSPS